LDGNVRHNLIHKLKADQSGNAITEFGLIAVPLVMMLMGVMDAGHGYYVESVLNGTMEDAGRASSLEGATSFTRQSIIDSDIRAKIRNIAPTATVNITRRFYKTFSQAAAARAETIVMDTAPIGQCGSTETFIDANNNGIWDADGGDAGQGGSKDVVIIKVSVSFPRMLPTAALLGFGEEVQLISDSILANQPYAAQTALGPSTTRPCA
jgi:Flp pilus assembly pilin Flp